MLVKSLFNIMFQLSQLLYTITLDFYPLAACYCQRKMSHEISLPLQRYKKNTFEFFIYTFYNICMLHYFLLIEGWCFIQEIEREFGNTSMLKVAL